MIQSMEILQLPVMALEERIRQELDDNPALELKEPTLEEVQAEEAEDGAPAAEEPAADPDGELVIDDNNELDFNRLDALAQDYGESFNEEHRPSRNGIDEEGDRKHDAMSNMPSRPQSLHDYLKEQLTFLDATPDQVELLEFMISHLNENGYLTAPLNEVAETFVRPVTADEAEDALSILQKLDPPGVGARNLCECLLLQLTPETPTARCCAS